MNLIGMTVAGYLVLTGAVFLAQRTLLYPGAKDPPDLNHFNGLGLKEVATQTSDGLRLAHWYRPPANSRAPVVVVFQGNAGHMGDRVSKLTALLRTDFGMLFVGYRGFSGNPGKPTENDLSADARGVLDWLADQGVGPGRTVLYGESLGSGVAVKMAAERPVAAVILESPYTSIAEVAQEHYWFLPARWMLLDKWDSIARIGAIGAPLLILHGGRDRTVPLRFGRALFAAAAEPKQFIEIDQAGHVDLFDFPQVPPRVIEFIRANAVAGGT